MSEKVSEIVLTLPWVRADQAPRAALIPWRVGSVPGVKTAVSETPEKSSLPVAAGMAELPADPHAAKSGDRTDTPAPALSSPRLVITPDLVGRLMLASPELVAGSVDDRQSALSHSQQKPSRRCRQYAS